MSAPRTAAELRPTGLAACGVLLLAGAALPAWAWAGGLRLAPAELFVCALPALIGLVVVALPGSDARQFLGRIVACLLMMPILLLMWGDSLDLTPPDAAPSTATSGTLDQQQLFAGALAQQQVPAAALPPGGPQLMRAAMFRDGLELRLQRFADTGAAQRQFTWLAEAQQGHRSELAGRSGLRLAPAGWLELHGRELIELRGPEALIVQHLRELPAPTAMSPPPASPPAERRFWPFGLGFCLVHLLCFLGFVLWAGSRTTRVGAEVGRATLTPPLLDASLRSLNEAGLPLRVEAQGAGQWQVEHLGPDPARSHRLLLRLDARRRRLLVREIASASAATPVNEDEARMGSIADEDYRGAARPSAQQIWGKAIQTTLIEPERLGALRASLRLREGRAELTASCRDPLDGDGMVTLLCALVTRCGYHWQPVFWWPKR